LNLSETLQLFSKISIKIDISKFWQKMKILESTVYVVFILICFGSREIAQERGKILAKV